MERALIHSQSTDNVQQHVIVNGADEDWKGVGFFLVFFHLSRSDDFRVARSCAVIPNNLLHLPHPEYKAASKRLRALFFGEFLP
jgi:hypothetical protein